MSKLSMILPVYNEEQLLEYSLKTTLPYVDEVIIVDGSPFGPSTDKTRDIIEQFIQMFPGKIQYCNDTFNLGDDVWDESRQRNLALSKVSGDFLMPHCGDMIYDDSDMQLLREAIDMYSDRKVFFCFFLEFWCDTNHIRLYRDATTFNNWFPVPVVGDIPIFSMDLEPYYYDGPKLKIKDETLNSPDFVYVHHATRYHLGWVSPFKKQVEKHVRNIKQRAWGELGDDLISKGDKAIYSWAINHVLAYEGAVCGYPYVGRQPQVLNNKNFSYLEGYEATMQEYEERFGQF